MIALELRLTVPADGGRDWITQAASAPTGAAVVLDVSAAPHAWITAAPLLREHVDRLHVTIAAPSADVLRAWRAALVGGAS